MTVTEKLGIVCLVVALLTACSATKPLPRCTDDFQPINPDTVIKP